MSVLYCIVFHFHFTNPKGYKTTEYRTCQKSTIYSINIQENNIKHINIQETIEGPRQAQHDTQVQMLYTYARDLKVPR
jgi:hypothetical protein